MSLLKCQALPPTSVSLVKSGAQPELRCNFQTEHLKPTGLLVVPVQQQSGIWYHVSAENQMQAHQRIAAADIPATAQLLNLQQRQDISFTNTSFELRWTGLQPIIDHIRKRTKLPEGARWLSVLLHPQITTDIKRKPDVETMGKPLDSYETWNCPAHACLADMLLQQHQPAMQGRISNGLLHLP